ncbi:hypothetical protein [Nostoc sp.]
MILAKTYDRKFWLTNSAYTRLRRSTASRSLISMIAPIIRTGLPVL